MKRPEGFDREPQREERREAQRDAGRAPVRRGKAAAESPVADGVGASGSVAGGAGGGGAGAGRRLLSGRAERLEQERAETARLAAERAAREPAEAASAPHSTGLDAPDRDAEGAAFADTDIIDTDTDFVGLDVAGSELADNDFTAADPAAHGSSATEFSAAEFSAADEQLTTEIEPLTPPAKAAGLASVKRALAPLSARNADPVRSALKRVRSAEKRSRQRTKAETRRFTAALRRTRRRTFVVIGAVLALVAFVAVCAFTPLMAVRNIEVVGAKQVDTESVTKVLSEFAGTPLALVDEGDVLRALGDFPLIQRFAVERKPPHTLVVRIEERVPVIAIAADEKFKLYDAAGVLVSEGDERPEGVPLAGDGLGSTASKAFLAASKIVRDLPAELRAEVDSVNAQTGQDVTFVLRNGIEVFWGNDSQTRRKALVLQTLMGSLGDRSVSYIDVSSSDAPIFR